MSRFPALSIVFYATACMQLGEIAALDFFAGVSVDMISALHPEGVKANGS